MLRILGIYIYIYVMITHSREVKFYNTIKTSVAGEFTEFYILREFRTKNFSVDRLMIKTNFRVLPSVKI